MEDKIRKVFFQALVEHKIVILRLPTPVAQAAPKTRIEPVVSQYQPVVSKPQRKWDDFAEEFIDIEPNWIQLRLRDPVGENYPYTIINPKNDNVIASGRLDANGYVDVDLPIGIDEVHVYLGEYRTWKSDIFIQPIGAFRDAAQEFLNTLYELAKQQSVNQREEAFFYANALNFNQTEQQRQEALDYTRSSQDEIRQSANPVQLPDVPQPVSNAGALIRGVGQFIVGFVPVFRALKFIKPTTQMGNVARGMAAGAIVDATFFAPYEKKLADLIQEYPELQNPVTEYLATSENDSQFEARLKRSLEGLLLGAFTEGLFQAIRIVKYAKIKPVFKNVQTRSPYELKAEVTEVKAVDTETLVKSNEVKTTEVTEKIKVSDSINPNILTIGKLGYFDIDDLIKSGNRIDPTVKNGNLTVAGRALQKHGSRDGSVYPIATGNPSQMNKQGQEILNDILKADGIKIEEGNRFGGFDIIAPSGKGARFDLEGSFRGFLEP